MYTLNTIIDLISNVSHFLTDTENQSGLYPCSIAILFGTNVMEITCMRAAV